MKSIINSTGIDISHQSTPILLSQIKRKKLPFFEVTSPGLPKFAISVYFNLFMIVVEWMFSHFNKVNFKYYSKVNYKHKMPPNQTKQCTYFLRMSYCYSMFSLVYFSYVIIAFWEFRYSLLSVPLLIKYFQNC